MDCHPLLYSQKGVEKSKRSNFEPSSPHQRLIEEASLGLADIAAGKVKNARSTLEAIKRRRSDFDQFMNLVPNAPIAEGDDLPNPTNLRHIP